MIKKFYLFAWFLLGGSILFSIAQGPTNGLQMVVFSLVGLALIYGFALWAVLTNTPDIQNE